MDAQTQKITRRRFLSVCAMAGACSVLPWTGVRASLPLHRWNGILLGAHVHLTLAHPDKAEATRIFKNCVSEIKRLENIFTLYDAHSELSQLNTNGILQNPSPEMVDILEQARMAHDITGGAFDVTVKALEEGKSLELVGMDKLHVTPKEIRFEKQGMGVTLNGIAQGYITDRITELLKAEGLQNVLVELGEKRAIGTHPSGRPWLLALQGQKEPIALNGRALATSAACGPGVNRPHIFIPRSGAVAQKHQTISVLAQTATLADAFSTGFMGLSRSEIFHIKALEPRVLKVYLG